MALKRDLAGWLDAKLTEIERRHRLDEKNSALLRAMAVKRFSKYSRATAGVSVAFLLGGFDPTPWQLSLFRIRLCTPTFSCCRAADLGL